jgi:serine/threonine-protein kinase
MSPEQALGKPLDHRADIYSVGVIMYELFTGRVPFEAESFMGILTKHITTQPMPPRQAAPERQIPEAIEAVILRALAKEAEERYQSMADLAGDLAAIASEQAPEVLLPRPSSGSVAQISKPLSVAMPARHVTPMPRPPSGALPLGGEAEAAPKKKSALPYFVVAGILVAAAAGAVVWVTRGPSQTVTPPPVKQPPVAVVAPPPVKQPDPPPAPVLEEVIVDSVPPGAKIFVDGEPLGDTPETVKVEEGKTKSVTLKKEGFVDSVQTVDPGKTHKLLVRLEHVKKAAVAVKGGKPGKLPAPPPASLDPPPKAPPVVAAPPPHPPAPPKKKRVVDPYERVDENPPKKSQDVLNPY